MTDKTALLIAGGVILDYSREKQYLPKSPFVICADGGYDHLKGFGFNCDVVIGDMDSITMPVADGVTRMQAVQEKDETDTRLALDYLLDRGYTDIIMMGAMGGRCDHLFANMMLLEYALQRGACLRIIDGNTMVTLALGPATVIVRGTEGDSLSLFSLTENITNVVTENLHYPLYGKTLTRMDSLGISNVMLGGHASVQFDTGKMLIMHTANGVNEIETREKTDQNKEKI